MKVEWPASQWVISSIAETKVLNWSLRPSLKDKMTTLKVEKSCQLHWHLKVMSATNFDKLHRTICQIPQLTTRYLSNSVAHCSLPFLSKFCRIWPSYKSSSERIHSYINTQNKFLTCLHKSMLMLVIKVVILICEWVPCQLSCYTKNVTITTTIEIYNNWTHNYAKFCGNGEIPRQWPYSAARFKIPWPVENWTLMVSVVNEVWVTTTTITLSIHLCVQHDGRDATEAETCWNNASKMTCFVSSWT